MSMNHCHHRLPTRPFWLQLISLLVFHGGHLMKSSSLSSYHSHTVLKLRRKSHTCSSSSSRNTRKEYDSYIWHSRRPLEEEVPDESLLVLEDDKSSTMFVSRRNLCLASFSCVALLTPTKEARAITKEFPMELTYTDNGMSASQKRQLLSDKKASRKLAMDSINEDPLLFRSTSDLVATVVWTGALWLTAGSRSNPLVTPVANILYDPDEQFLKDRNEGYFSALPPGLSFVLLAIFLVLGFILDRTLLLLYLGDQIIVLQLATVALVAAGALELGRISAGEKVSSREDVDRASQLEQEFETFSNQRLLSGGNVHRSEVVDAFRRFNPKYRDRESVEYPLSDLEIERMMRLWTRKQRKGNDMTSAGYFNGVQLNTDADIVLASNRQQR